MVAGVRANYLLDVAIQALHVLGSLRIAQVDRPLPALSGTAPARLLPSPPRCHAAEVAEGVGITLSCGLLVPRQRLLVVHIDTFPVPEHVAEVILAAGVAREKAAAKGIAAFELNQDVISRSTVIVIAVKPNVVPSACEEIAKAGFAGLVISIAAGVTIGTLANVNNEGGSARVIRVMPNTPCLVGMAASAFALGPGATAADKETAMMIFGSVVSWRICPPPPPFLHPHPYTRTLTPPPGPGVRGARKGSRRRHRTQRLRPCLRVRGWRWG